MHRTGKKKKMKVKKTTKKKKRKMDSLVQTPTKTPTSTGLACIVCVCGFGEGRQGGAWGRRSQGWHRAGVHQDLAMAWVFRLLGHKGTQGGVRVVGGGGQVAEHMKSGEKKEKKKIRTHTKTQVARCVVHVQLTCGQVVCRGGLASSMWRNLAECDVENCAVSRDRR